MKPGRQLAWWVTGVAAFVLLIWLFQAILAPFVIGMAVAYLLDPLCRRVERLGLSRTLASLLVIGAFLLFALAVLALVVPIIVSELVLLLGQLPEYVKTVAQRLELTVMIWQAQLDPAVLEGVTDIAAAAQERVADWAGELASGIVSGGMAFFNLLALLLIAPIVAFYLLRDWGRLVDEVDALMPPAYAGMIRAQIREVDRRLSGFVRGVGLICLLLGVFYAVALTAVGLNFGLVIGMAAGLVSFVPFVGAVLGFVASVGMALLQFDSYLMVALVGAIFLVGQFIEGNILHPTLVGERVGLHPVWVIFALLAGGVAFGLVGVLIAVPVAAVIGVGVRFAVQLYRAKVFGAPMPEGAPQSETPASDSSAGAVATGDKLARKERP